MKTCKIGLCLMHQNCPFLDGKVLQKNLVFSIKDVYACALEYGHNICNFANSSFGIQICTLFPKVTVLHSNFWT